MPDTQQLEEAMWKEIRLIMLACLCVCFVQMTLFFLSTGWLVVIHMLIITVVNLMSTTEWSTETQAIVNYLVRFGVSTVGLIMTFPILLILSIWYSKTTTLWEFTFGKEGFFIIHNFLWLLSKLTSSILCFLVTRVLYTFLLIFSMCTVKLIDAIVSY